MNCEYFGTCGSCTLYNMNYEEQLEYKLQRESERFKEFYEGEIDIVKSEEQNFRNRAEFRIYHYKQSGEISYAMNGVDKKPVCIDSCQIVSSEIYTLMPKLLDEVRKSEILKYKFFSVEFLGSLKGDMLVTMIYHKKLDEAWKQEALEMQKRLGIKIIGRARKQKIVLDVDFIEESFNIQINSSTHQLINFKYFEGGFTQPNQRVNIGMIEWVLENSSAKGGLCELYCGGGNFTIPLSKKFDKVLATEISKTSIRSAKLNCELNGVDNIEFIRMSSEEFVEALRGDREFNRLKDVDLSSYSFGNIYSNSSPITYHSSPNTIFVDPPRAGLDETTRELAKKFEQIIYISCNPETLHRDLCELGKTYEVKRFALFDQFAYTKHIECGVLLGRNQISIL